MPNSNVSLERSIEINSPDYLHTCTKCGISKPNTEYTLYSDKRIKSGLGRNYISQCKLCRRAYNALDRVKERKNLRAPLIRKKNRMSAIYGASIGNARKKNLEHNITVDYLKELFISQNGLCYYTGKPMLVDLRDVDSNNNSVSLDRIDSSQGYIKGNVVLCRWIVNRIKNDVSLKDLLEIVSDINTKFNTP